MCIHSHNLAKLRLSERHHRQTRLADQLDVLQSRIAFDLTKRHRMSQWFQGSQIDSGPIAFLRCRIRIRGSHHFRDPDNGFVLAAMIEKDFIAFLHSAKVISRSVIAHACPTGVAFADEVRPRIGGWFLFYQPKILHA